jgi:hypothetical protein
LALLLLLGGWLALLLLLGGWLALLLLRSGLALLLLGSHLTLLLRYFLALLLRSGLALLLLRRLALLLLGSRLTLLLRYFLALLLLRSRLALLLLLGGWTLLLLRSFLVLRLLRGRITLLRHGLIVRLQRRGGSHIAVCRKRLADDRAGRTALIHAGKLCAIGACGVLILHLRRHGRGVWGSHRRQLRGACLDLDSTRSAVEAYTPASVVVADRAAVDVMHD